MCLELWYGRYTLSAWQATEMARGTRPGTLQLLKQTKIPRWPMPSLRHQLDETKHGLTSEKSAERSPWTLKPWICSCIFREQKFSYIPSPPVSGCTFSPVICWKPLKTFRDHRRRWGALLQDSKVTFQKYPTVNFRIQQDPLLLDDSSSGILTGACGVDANLMSRKHKVGRFSRWKSWILHGC